MDTVAGRLVNGGSGMKNGVARLSGSVNPHHQEDSPKDSWKCENSESLRGNYRSALLEEADYLHCSIYVHSTASPYCLDGVACQFSFH